MITNNHSWSLGATSNKSLELIGPSIPIHLPGDPRVTGVRKASVLRPSLAVHPVDSIGVDLCPFVLRLRRKRFISRFFTPLL
jgi:hypothetical protein